MEKKARADIQQFTKHLEANLYSLGQELQTGTYQHEFYTQFKVFEPKMRIISKATVRDRLVHHVLASALNTIFERKFIFHSYASRPGKGTHQGVVDLQKILYKATQNNTSSYYFLKCDIKKFFNSADQNILYQLLSAHIHDSRLLDLLSRVIYSYRTVPDSPEQVGFPIGNVTSQVFSNIYMNELDQYVKRTLKALYYLRYSDDFLLLSHDRDFLVHALASMQTFLKERLHLTLHPLKITLAPHQQGIDWLGYHLFFDHRFLRTTTKRRMVKRFQTRIGEHIYGRIALKQLQQTAASYIGMLAHATQYRLSMDISKLFGINMPTLKRIKDLFFLKRGNKIWQRKMQRVSAIWESLKMWGTILSMPSPCAVRIG